MTRYRFKTRNVEDFRPLIFMAQYPWWCTGGDLDSEYATIVCYLPENVSLELYWDDAFDIDKKENVKIEFSDRMPKPDWYLE